MIDMAEVADEIVTIEQNETFPLPPRRHFESLLPRPQSNPFIGWEPPPVHLRHYVLRDVVLDGATMALLRNGTLLRESPYLLPDAQLATITAAHALPDCQPVRTLIGSNAIHRNYYHWLIQAVPAIDAAVRRNAGRPIRLALAPESQMQRDSLALLGHENVPRLTILTDRRYALSEAEYSGLLSGDAVFQTSRRQTETFARLRRSVKLRHAPRERLYVARTDAPVRRMQNESTLVARLRERGFRIVEPGGLSFREQISLFRHARFVVGPHGAGLSNIVFCEPGTLVYELVPALYQNSCFTILADLGGLRYWADIFASEGATAGFDGDWAVDVDDVLRRIDDIDRLDPLPRASRVGKWLATRKFWP